MADKRCFVQFPHPGDEHKPDSHRKIGWNKTYREKRVNPHKRKFMQFRGDWIDEADKKHTGDLCAWGEWEPESDIIREFNPQGGVPHAPRYLWFPYWVPRNSYRGLHNTDPFIFGDHFLYSNCGQSAPSKRGLKHLDQGSVIAFGSGKKVHGKRKWVLDTVLVVSDSIAYEPLHPRKALEGRVPDAFLEVTGGPLAENTRKGAASGACAPTSASLRLYLGATPDKPVCGMYSFFPARPAGHEAGFPRPVIRLDDDYFNCGNWQAPKGAQCNLSPDTLRFLWDSLVGQVRKAGLVLGTRAEMPKRFDGPPHYTAPRAAPCP